VAEWADVWRVVVEDQSGKEYKMDDYQVRSPTNVEDVARVLYDLARECAYSASYPYLNYSYPNSCPAPL
jgi:S-adenosylmethionine synthetase